MEDTPPSRQALHPATTGPQAYPGHRCAAGEPARAASRVARVAAKVSSRSGSVTPAGPGGRAYLTKYQSSGLMLSVGLCGLTPRRLLATSVRL